MFFKFGKYSFLTQIFLCFILVLFSWLLLSSEDRNVTVAFYLLGSILLSISMTIEQLRSRLFLMSELEKTCPYSLEKLYGLKMLISSFIVLVGVGLSSLILSSNEQYDFLILLEGGCIPFFFLNALCLQLQDETGGSQMIISVYALIVFVSMILPLYSYTVWFSLLETFGTYGMIISMLYLCMVYKKKYWVITRQ